MALFNRDKFKRIFFLVWPFLALAVVVFFSWNYIKQFLPISIDEEVKPNPEVIYDMRDIQDELLPMSFTDRQARMEKFLTAEEAAAIFGAGETAGPDTDLAAAVLKAPPGTVITLVTGEYRLNFNLDKDITLVGAGEGTILLAADSEQPVIKSVGAKIVLSNLVIKDSKIGILAEGGEIEVKRVKLDNLAATACYGSGVKLDFSESYIYNSLSALKLLNSSGAITDSIIKDNAKSGVELRQSEFKIEGNVITNNKSYGVFLDGYSQAEIKNNYIEGNIGWNVRVEGERKIYK